jgi:hypothetical protein
LGEDGLPAYAVAKMADLLEKRALAADALARVKDRLLSAEIQFHTAPAGKTAAAVHLPL